MVGGGTLFDDRCYNRCSNLGCHRTWTLVDEAGERHFFGLFLPDLGADGETMPALISMSDAADTCRPNDQSQTASRYGYVRVCAGMGRSRGVGGWQFGNDAIMSTGLPERNYGAAHGHPRGSHLVHSWAAVVLAI